jgi:drug/metabolite transporter (DMT)-like permease
MSKRGWALFAAMAIIWGIPYLMIKVAVGHVSPVFLVFCRTAGGTLLLLPVVLARHEFRGLLRHWRALLLYTVAEITVPWLLLFWAETRVSSSFAALLIAATPLVGAVLAAALGSRDRLDRTRGVGLLIGFTGVAALVGFDVRGGELWAALAIGVVAIGYATGPFVIDRRLTGLPSTAVVIVSLLGSAVVYAPFALTSAPAAMPPASAIWAIALLIVVCTATAFLVFFRLIAEVGPARASVITYINPVVAAIAGLSIGNEHLSTGMVVGFPLVIVGSVVATRRSRAPIAPGQESAAPAQAAAEA